ncbi:ABC transporter substrate-binding protein [Sodalis sp. dw_96]|uniref:ABC transporter substrate-binding protein n=1 Tax=Sodalis sp. dw_96 TaxID=2719794 RepID=UPI001BD27319|nr:ABC transporter substrate-binding protein [Sodalis sp. dw_96]
MSRSVIYGSVTRHAAVLSRFGAQAGFFAREGIDLTIKEVYGGPEMAAAVESGEVHIGEVGTPPGLTAIGEGKRIRIVGSSLDRGLAFFLIARADITHWDDFKGKTVAALSRGSCGYWYLRDILEQNGVDPDQDVTFRYLGGDMDRQLELLKAGEIAGLLSGEPYLSLGERSGVARSWGAPQKLADVPSIQWSIQIAGQDFIEREPALLRDVLEVIRQTAHYALDNPDEWLSFYQKLYGVDIDIARNSIKNEWPLFHFDGQIDIPGLERALDLQYRIGSTARRLSLDEVLDLRYQPQPSVRPLVLRAG